jgi:hypothetical protein
VESPVVIGAGDCPRCGGDVVFDLHRDEPERAGQAPAEAGRWARLRRLLGR